MLTYADVKIDDVTPMMQQYLLTKKEYMDCILLYRLGDFYETFFEDAELLSRELQITLTGRDAGKKLGRVPLAGIPVKQVALCLQVKDTLTREVRWASGRGTNGERTCSTRRRQLSFTTSSTTARCSTVLLRRSSVLS